MAITAKFFADFEQFNTATQAAQAKLNQFSTTSQSSLQKVATETQQVGGSMEGLLGTVGRVAAAVGIGFSIGAVVNFGRAVLADADALVKMSDKTGISLQGLQKFQIAGDDAGNTIDQLTMAVNQMQNRLAGGDASALGALTKLGLSFEDLQRLSPDQQFMAIAEAIRGIKNPADQVNVAMDLFGRSGAEILPTIKRGFDDLKDASVGMSDETVKNLDAVGDAFSRMWRAFKGGTADAVVGLWHALAQAEGSVILSEGELAGAIQLTAEELATINAPQAKYIENVKASGLSTSEEAAIIKDLNRQLEGQQATLKAVAAADAEATTAMKAHWTEVGSIVDRVLGVDAIKSATNWMDAIDALGGSISHFTNKDLTELEESMLAALDVMARNGTLTDEASSKYAALAVQAHQLAAAMGAVKTETAAWTAVENQVIVVGQAVTASIQSTAQSFAGLTVNIAATNEQMSAFYATLADSSNVGTPGADNIGVPSGGVGNLASAAAASAATLRRFPARAGGGAVSGGSSYMVGERGPELFTPGASGFVSAGGGGMVNHFYLVDNSENLARKVSDLITKNLRRSGPV